MLGPLSESRLVGWVISVACAAVALVSVIAAIVSTPGSLLGLAIAGASWSCFGYRYLRPAHLVEDRLVVSRWPGQVTSLPRKNIVNAGYRQVASMQAPRLMVIEPERGRPIILWGSWGRPREEELLNDLLQDWRIAGATNER